MTAIGEGEYSVAAFLGDGTYWYVVRWVDPQHAMNTAKRCTDRASMMPRLARVIVTDGGDSTVFEWKRGIGVTWPTTSASAAKQ